VKRKIISILAAVLIVLVALPADALAAPPGEVRPGQAGYALDEIVVGFKPGVAGPWRALLHNQLGGHARANIPALGAQVVSVPAGTVGNSVRRYASHPLVAYAETNYIAEVVGEPNDPYYGAQWGLHKVEAPAAWETTTGSAAVITAILDTGVDQNHPDLRDKIVKNVNFTDSSTVDDIHGHGTHVAGIAAAATNNGVGVAGLGYDSTIMNVKVLGDDGSGYYSWVINGIIWAADNGAQVINMSLGGSSSSRALEDAINYAWSKGVVVVAAAGNSGSTSPFYPAHYANCMAVAATDRYDNKPSWSNYGSWVDVAAPGVSIYATLKGSSYGYKSGTSMASPHVAGLAALVFTVVSDDNGNGRLNDEVRFRIESTCDDIGVSGIGSGRINAARAVAVEQPDPEPEPDPEPGVEIALSADPASVSEAGTMVTYTYTVSNTGEVSLTGIVVTDDLLRDIVLDDSGLVPGASTTGTATYMVTQSDIDSGADIVNIATVTCDQDVTDTSSATVTITQLPDISIVEVANPTSVSQAGDVIEYTYTVSNTGKVTLTGLEVYDDLLGDISLTATSLTPGESTSGTATYTVTQADIDSGADIVNTANVTTDQGVSDSASATVNVVQDTAVQIALSADPASVSEAGDVITYTYTVTNAGRVTLTGMTVMDDRLGSIALYVTTLTPGDVTSGLATYMVTQADIDSGADMVNTATATCDQGVTDTTSAVVSIVQIPAVSVALFADRSSVSQAGDVITYTYTVTNPGKVTLTGITATDDKLGSISMASSLAPGESATGSATYTVTQNDIDSGTGLLNTASVTTDQGVTDSESVTVTVVQYPDVRVSLSAEPTSVSQAGDVINYTYTVASTGKVTLTGIAVYDDLLGNIALAATLAPGASTTGTATYTVTQDDIDSGADIVNTATVITDQGVTDSASATVTVDVPPEVAAVTISPAAQTDRGWPGKDVTYEFTVENVGNVQDTYGVWVTSEWASWVTPHTLTLEPGDSAVITVTHSVPKGAAPLDSDSGIVEVFSAHTGASASAGFTTTARVSSLSITPGTQSAIAVPGETVRYTYTISNTGTEDDVYNLAVSAAWECWLSMTSVSLAAGESAQVVVSHTVLEGAVDGASDSGSLTATSARASAGATFATTAEQEQEPVAPVIDRFDVTDSSNSIWVRVTVDWAVSDADGDLATVSVLLSLSGSVVDSVTYSVSGYEASGSCQLRQRSRRGAVYEVTIIVTDAAGNAVSQREPDPEPGVEIALSADPASVSEAGSLISYTYVVTNTGEANLTGIVVIDDRLGDITLEVTSLAPGASITGTATYTVIQNDIDAGADIVNTATVATDQGVTASDGVTVTVDAPEAPIGGVTISPPDQSGWGWAGEDVTYQFTVQNTGNVLDTYEIRTISDWASAVLPQKLTLEPGDSAVITATHSVREGVAPRDSDSGTVEVLSSATRVSASATFATAARVSAMSISPGTQSATAVPGHTVQYTYTISNTGTEDDVYDLTTISQWDSSVSHESIELPEGDSVEVTVTHTVPAQAHDNDCDSGSLIAELRTDASTAAAVTFITTAEQDQEPVSPVIDRFDVTDSSSSIWVRVTVDWAVSDADGDLATVRVLLSLNGSIVDSATYSVAGYEASGSCQLRQRSRRGAAYAITLEVTDAAGNKVSETRSLSS